ALAIIESGSDIAVNRALGMSSSDLTRRQKVLDELRDRLLHPPAQDRPRPVLKKPQAFLMDIGDVVAYPTWCGYCINPYAPSKESDPPWEGQGGWSAFVVIDRGRAFDFLVWYTPLVMCDAMPEKPTVEALRAMSGSWRRARSGTCSAVHFKRMELEKIGRL